MNNHKSLQTFSQQQKNNLPKRFALLSIGSLFIFTAYFVYYNVKYMDVIAANRIQDFEQRTGMKIHEFKTENPIKEEIRPEYIEKQKRIYRQKLEETRKLQQQIQK